MKISNRGHPDWSEITVEEAEQLEDEVRNDLRFDNDEGDLEIWFDHDDLERGYLSVNLAMVHVLTYRTRTTMRANNMAARIWYSKEDISVRGMLHGVPARPPKSAVTSGVKTAPHG